MRVSTFWIHRESGTVAVDDAVLKGVDTSSLPKNVQLVWWYGDKGEIRYTDEDRLPIREPVTDLEPFIPVFNNWMRVAQTPLPTTSGKTMPAITLAQAKAVKSDLVRGLYRNKLAQSSPSGDPTAALADAVNISAQNFAADIYYKINAPVNQTADAINQSLPGSINGAAFSGVAAVALGVPSTQVPTWNNVGGPAGDPYAGRRNTHLANVNAQSTVEGVAAYDITAGW